MKNPTPKQLALLAAGFIFSICLIGALGIVWLDPAGGERLYILLLPAIIFLAAYAAFYFALEKFIYRKIKLVYKTIHRFKTAKSAELSEIDMDKDLISEVNQEVIAWAEDKKQEIEELKSSATYRREFLGNISHELKTPIFNVQGYIDTLLSGGLEDAKVNKEYLYKANKNVDRLITIIEDLDAISKLESGRLQLHLEKFDIRQLTREVFEASELLAEAYHVALDFKDNPEKPVYVIADKESIRQVMTNLIANGIKYSKEDGHVRVGFYDMDENILIEIADDGLGIDEQHLPRLFERFYRVEESRARDKGGTGLGLAIVKHIIEAHQQTINVRSQPGYGSTFGFTLKKGT